ncbi:MAG: putative rane protein [Hyphomicrobiales bacterium]|jgi:putative membrane protein|nr:putative rane protein [Hyphomicrobiales bacterium]
MVLQSLSGLPAFLVYFVCGSVLVAAYVFVYTWITAHDEFALLKANNTGAAIALGLSMIGFAVPLTASIGHSDGILDMTIWGVIALIVQVGVYYVARIAVPKLSERIEAGEIAPAIWLGATSVTAGMLNAASMGT